MPIRDHNSAQSATQNLEDEWFKKAEKLDQDPHRFIFMEKGKRNMTWTMKVDLSNTKGLIETEWMIDHDKYINRPDVISHKFYGNSKYWWIIAERNGITDPFHGFYKGRVLFIPDLNHIRKILGL